MNVYVSVKQAGRRKDYIAKKELSLKDPPFSLRELITEIVRKSLAEYNNKVSGFALLNYLTAEDLENQALIGKVAFAEFRNKQAADGTKAKAAAIQAFEDGIYRVFINEHEMLALDEKVPLKEGDTLTFIRLTMLAGRMW